MKRTVYLYFAIVTFIFVVSSVFYTFYKTSWSFRSNVNTIKRIGLSNISVYYDFFNGIKISFKSDGLTIVGDLYNIDNSTNKPGIILIHGASPFGRKLAIYRLIARELSLRGYVVIKIDIRGFGDSDDPSSLNDLDALDGSRDVINALTYLTSLPYVNQSRIYIIGHSMGGRLAIKAGVYDQRVRKIIAIGPPRRIKERIKNEFSYFQKRYSRDRKLDKLVPSDIFLQYVMSMAIDNHLNYFSSKDHKPIFLIDGQLEGGEDKLFLSEFYQKMTHPKKYLTILDTGHYLSTVNFFGGRFLFYNKKVMLRVMDEIDSWIKLESKV